MIFFRPAAMAEARGAKLKTSSSRRTCSSCLKTGSFVYFNPLHSYTLSGSKLRCLDCDDEEWMSGD